MDIILLVLACFYISNQLKAKGYIPRPWIWRLIGAWIGFELGGALLSMLITHGNLIMAGVFGFLCGVGGFLLIKSRVDNLPDINKKDWHDRLEDTNNANDNF